MDQFGIPSKESSWTGVSDGYTITITYGYVFIATILWMNSQVL